VAELAGMTTPVHIGDATLYLGDCLDVLREMDGNSIDAVITDPPYSSGGMVRGDRAQKTSMKYVQSGNGETCRTEFSGDNRDQRAFLAWATMWLAGLHRNATDGAVCMVFTDWRQLPTVTDAVQCGGWVWRNLVTWWKPGVRMQRGRFSASSEYVVYASRGVPASGEKSPQNVLQFQPVSGVQKEHIAEKPVDLLKALIGVTRQGSAICDPFMGSGTTGVAALQMGRKFVGIELDAHMFDIACRRIEDAQRQQTLDLKPSIMTCPTASLQIDDPSPATPASEETA
jgi:site-specific DNA-methyltransferase (adenine-specific)